MSFNDDRKFFVLRSIQVEGGGIAPKLIDGITLWSGNLLRDDLYLIVTPDAVDAPRAKVDFDPLTRADELKSATGDQLDSLLPVRLHNDATNEEIRGLLTRLGADRSYTIEDLNKWKNGGK